MPLTDDSARRQTLVRLARRLQITERHIAAGLCLSISMELALAVCDQCGGDVRLVRWRVVDDPQFVDHWAVEFDADRVLDLTRVQVDGSKGLICPVAGYPANYVGRAAYPVSLFADAYLAQGGSRRRRLSDKFLWTCGAGRLGFDLSRAYHAFDTRAGMSALVEFARFARCFLVGATVRALQRRVHTLLRRSLARADFAAETAQGSWESLLTRPEPRSASVVDLLAYKARRDASGHGAAPTSTVRSNRSPRSH